MISFSRVRSLLAKILGRLRTSRVGILLLVGLGELGVVALAWTTVALFRVGLPAVLRPAMSLPLVVAVIVTCVLTTCSVIRRRFRFGITHLLAATFVAAAFASWIAPDMIGDHRNGRAAAMIARLGGATTVGSTGSLGSWFQRRLGVEMAGSIHHVRFPPGTTLSDAELALLAELPDLTGLELPGARVTDGGLQQLATSRRLGWIDLTGANITDRGAAHLAALPTLKYLNLSGTKVTDRTIHSLRGHWSLENLDLKGTRVTGWAFASLKDSKRLRYLNLNGTPLADKEIRRFKGCGTVESLLSDTPLTDEGVGRLVRGLGAEILNLNLARTKITAKSAEGLSTLTRLGFLDLTGTAFSDAGLLSLSGLGSLRFLRLDQTNVTNAGLVHLGQMERLGFLGLSKTAVSDSGLASLSAMVSLSQLDLSGTQVTAAGLAELAALPSLHELNLCDSRVSDEHLTNLLLLRQRPMWCYLEGTLVSDVGLRSLVDARTSVAYQPAGITLTVGRTRVTPTGVRFLERAMGTWFIVDHARYGAVVTQVIAKPPARRPKPSARMSAKP